jgi:hypothetical protein
MPKSRFLIYGLVDPRTGHLRYVGKSTSGLRRARMHVLPCTLRQTKNTHKGHWVQALVDVGLAPQITVLQEVAGPEDLYELEQGWISYFRGLGCPLTNATDGGPGVFGLKRQPPSAETRAKLSAAAKGRVYGPEVRARFSAGQKARNYSPPPETRAKMAAAKRGRKRGPHTDETKAKMSAAQRGHFVSEATRIKIGDARRGQPFVDETGRMYRTQEEAAVALGISGGNISSCLKGMRKTTGGHSFRYAEAPHA